MKQGFSIGRIHQVSPSLGEAYFLRILLNKVKGPKSFEDIRTVDGQTFPTFRDACYALGLLNDDTKYIEAIKEASASGSVLSLPESQIKNLTLCEIEKYLLRNNSSLRRFQTMPYPDNDSIASSNNRLIVDELSYDTNALKNEFHSLISSLTNEQRRVFDEIMNAVEANKGGVFFLYVYGGTGKTFLWKTICGRHYLWKYDLKRENVGGLNYGKATIDIPNDLLINDSSDPIQSLIDFVYPSILQNIENIDFFRERALLAPTNEDIQDINDRLLSFFPGDEKEYLSSDSICPTEDFVDPP
ncbi:uncharacterized protein LOC143532501 [Bidens hawaiensis]|uniref:uncharacterized protein LOC143532501 n=1 Tax=Bidens hawaiensis TaxID=980011 RepID=UPI00404A9773